MSYNDMSKNSTETKTLKTNERTNTSQTTYRYTFVLQKKKTSNLVRVDTPNITVVVSNFVVTNKYIK